MDPLDDLLANLAGAKPAAQPANAMPLAQPLAASPKPAAIQSSIEALLRQIGEAPPPSIGPSPTPPVAAPPPAADQTLLREVRDQYSAVDRAKQESQRLAEAAVAQLAQSRRRSQAKLWLDQLDPDSGEALWFEQFAEGYPTRLEAAIALIEAEQASG
jgi:hypothetical protein